MSLLLRVSATVAYSSLADHAGTSRQAAFTFSYKVRTAIARLKLRSMDTGYGHQCKQHGENSSQVDTRQQGQGNIKIYCRF